MLITAPFTSKDDQKHIKVKILYINYLIIINLKGPVLQTVSNGRVPDKTLSSR